MKALRWHAAAAFLTGTFLIFFLYVGLPYDFSADLVRQYEPIRSMSYQEVLRHLINPLTPAWFYMEEIGPLRPVFNLSQKIFIDLFGVSLVPIHIAVALGHGFLFATFFLLVTAISRKKLYGWLSVLLYASFPTNAPELVGHLATALPSWLSMVSLGSVACFGCLTYQRQPLRTRRILLILGWVLLMWLAIKWKSHAKLLPIVTLTFLLLHLMKINRNIGTKFTVFLTCINLLMFLLVVPIQWGERTNRDHKSDATSEEAKFFRTFSTGDQRIFEINFSNIWSRMVATPKTENPLTTVLLSEAPSSFTGCLGFFLGWFFWLGLLTLPRTLSNIRRKMIATDKGSCDFLMHMFALVLSYFGIIVLAFAAGAPVTNVRFLDFVFVPGILVLSFEIRFTEALLDQNKAARWIFTSIISLFFLIAMIRNFPVLFKWVAHFGGIQHALVETEKTIYKKYYDEEPVGVDLYLKHQDLERKAVLVGWYELGPHWYERSLEKLATEGVLFLKARGEDDLKVKQFRTAGYRVEELGTYPFDEARPLMFQIHRWLSSRNILRKKADQIVLYQISFMHSAAPVNRT